MTNGTSSALEVWLSLVKALLWPAVVVALVMSFRADIVKMLPRVNEFGVAGATFKLGQAAERLGQEVTKAAGARESPTDAKVPAEVRALADARQALLIASTPSTSGALTRTGWMYCGRAQAGKWSSPPNLVVVGPDKLTAGTLYEVSTDTYLRTSPPMGTERAKGDVITVVPAGAQVRVLGTQPTPEPGFPDHTLFWVQVEYRTQGSY